jgi:ATP synthase protein I
MGLMLYAAQILLLFVFVAAFKNTTLFDPKVFAITLVVGTLAWIAAQTRAHMKAKILYVEPDSTTGGKPEKSGHSS